MDDTASMQLFPPDRYPFFCFLVQTPIMSCVRKYFPQKLTAILIRFAILEPSKDTAF